MKYFNITIIVVILFVVHLNGVYSMFCHKESALSRDIHCEYCCGESCIDRHCCKENSTNHIDPLKCDDFHEEHTINSMQISLIIVGGVVLVLVVLLVVFNRWRHKRLIKIRTNTERQPVSNNEQSTQNDFDKRHFQNDLPPPYHQVVSTITV